MSLTLNQMALESHAIAVQKGWYDKGGPAPLECHMLMVTEIAEASEEVRNKKPALYMQGSRIVGLSHEGMNKTADPNAVDIHYTMAMLEEQGFTADMVKPEGEATELADAIIRIGDYFAARGWDLEAVVALKMNYNRTRPQKHGGKAL